MPRFVDQAWVESDVKILDFAVIKENSWIQKYSIIQNKAIISGQASVRGTASRLTIVQDNSKVFGNAKVINGSTISENSQVYGTSIVNSSSVLSDAKVCEGYALSELIIDDDYFCNSQAPYSRAMVEIRDYRINHFNKKKDVIKFKASGARFSANPNNFKVYINGQSLESSNIKTYSNELWITAGSLQVDGFNQVKVYGLDEFGKKIISQDISFVVGSEQKNIQVNHDNEVIDASMDFFVTYEFGGIKFTGESRFEDGILTLKNLPVDLENYTVMIKGFGNKVTYYNEFSSISKVPENISTYLLPDFNNNDTSFSTLEGWKISHPENVFTSYSNGNRFLEIQPLENESITIAKTFNFSDYRAGLNLDFILPEVSNLFADSPGEIQLIFGSLKNKKLEVKTYDLISESSLEKKISLPNELQNGDYFLLIKIQGSLALKNSFSRMKLKNLLFPDVIVEFYPYHFNVMNRSVNSELPSTSILGLAHCSNSVFNINDPAKYRIYPDDVFKYFSAGPAWGVYDLVAENRVYGTLRVNGKKKSAVKNLRLVGVQNDIAKFDVPLATCAKKKFDEIPADQIITFNKTNNFISHLFSVPLNLSPNPIDVSPGSKISLYLKAEILNNNTSSYIISNEIPTDVLVYTEIAPNRRFGELDHYDTKGVGLYRTGGDRWILPAYENLFKALLDANPNWNVNDLTKLNGGLFKPHKAHNSGVDADLRFTETASKIFNFSAIQNLDTPSVPRLTKWKNALQSIEDFLEKTASAFHVIETNFLTLEDNESDNNVKWHGPFPKTYVLNFFQNRCIQNSNQSRYIDYREVPFERTLLSHEDEHWEHLHLRFNQPNINGSAKIIFPLTPNFDLDTLWFKFDSNGRLEISPQNPLSFKNFSILWRLQEDEGYENLDMNVEFGRWANGKMRFETSGNKSLSKSRSTVRHLSVVFADRSTGGCKERKVSFEIDNFDKRQTWTFKAPSSNNYQIFHKGEL